MRFRRHSGVRPLDRRSAPRSPKRLCVLLALAIVCCLPLAASAQTKSWDGGAATSNWGDALNWSPDGVPTSSNVVSLTGADLIDINVAASSGSMTLNNPGLVLTLVGTNTLTVNGAFTQTDGTFTGGAGNLDVNGNFVLVNGSFTAPSGIISVLQNFTYSGTATFDANGGTVAFDGSYANDTSVNAPGVTFNRVTINRTMVSGTTRTLTVAAGTTLSLGDTPTVLLRNNSQGYYLVNNGTLTVGTGTLTTNVDGNFTNSGVLSGGVTAWTHNGSFINAGTTTLGSAAILRFQNWLNGAGSYVNNAGSTLTTAASPTVDVAGSFVVNGGSTFPADPTLNLDGTYANDTSVNAPGVTFNRVTINRTMVSGTTRTLTVAAGTTLSLGDTPTVLLRNNSQGYYLVNNGTVTVGTGTFAANVDGTFTNNGTIITKTSTKTNSFGQSYTNAAGSTVEFLGDGDGSPDTQTITGFATSYRNLIINSTDGALDTFALASNATVNTLLTLSSGNITTAANTLSITSTGSVSRTSGHVVGNLMKYVPTGSPGRSFEIGDAGDYTPVNLSFASVTSGGTLTASTTAGDHANIGSSSIDPTQSANRTWTLSNSGIAFTTYDVRFRFASGDVDGGADPNTFIVGRYKGGVWAHPTTGTKTATSTQALGLASFGDFQVGEDSGASNPPAPAIGAAKASSSPVGNGNGTFDVTYTVNVENLGDVELFDVQVTDDLTSAFGTAVATTGEVDMPGEYTISAGPTITSNAANPVSANSSFDGSGDTNLMNVAGGGSLDVAETVTVEFTVVFFPDVANNPYANQATAMGDTAADGTADGDVSDPSDAGTDPDPDGDGDPDETGENDLTTLSLALGGPIVGVAKAVGGVTQTGPTTFDASFTLVVENLGAVLATNVQVTDDLAAAFAGVASVTVTAGPSATGGLSTANTNFDGTADLNLLSGTEPLGVGQSATVTFTIAVDLGAATGPFFNQAMATTAATPGGAALFSDLSDKGSDPDPDGDDDPDEPGENDPTPVSMQLNVPIVGLAKAVTRVTQTGPTTFDASFTLVVENLGAVLATNVQVTDDLAAAFAGVASVTVTAGPSATGGLSTANTNFDGTADLNLLSGTEPLGVGQSATVTFTIAVDLGAATGPFFNQAMATTAATPGGAALFSDLSDKGSDPDPDGDDDPDEPGENDPTPVSMQLNVPIVGLAKAVTRVTQTGPTTFDASFTLVVENLGAVPALNVQVQDLLADAFPGVVSVSVIATPAVTGGLSTANDGFDGTADPNLLSGSETLGVGEAARITFTVAVDVGAATGPFFNQATATTAATPGGAAFFTDVSDSPGQTQTVMAIRPGHRRATRLRSHCQGR